MTRQTLGLIVPMVNQTMAQELGEWLGPDVVCNVSRLAPQGREGGVLLPQDMPAYGAKALALVEAMSGQETMIVYGCTAGGFLAGRQAEEALLHAMVERSGKPAIGTAKAVADRLTADGARNIAVISPYSDAMNGHLADYLATFGINVMSVSKLALQPGEERRTAARIRALVLEAAVRRCGGVLLACSLVPTFAVLPGLRQELGRPVHSSISATADAIAAAAGLRTVAA
jgi:maleate cis-trans isomerase